MSSLPTSFPALILIEDQLDSVAQKYRSLLIIRGTILWVCGAIIASLVSFSIAPLLGPGSWCLLLLIATLSFLILTFHRLILKPLLFKPNPLHIAKMVENRFPTLHNGLTNSLLLAQADDLHASPWLNPIFNEIWRSINSSSSIHDAIDFKSLKKPLVALGICALVFGALFSIPASRHHLLWGFNQLKHPKLEAPRIGSVSILEVSPEEITLVAGQSLEIRVLAKDPDHAMPSARILFDPPDLEPVDLIPTSPDGLLHYAHHTAPIHSPLRFRAEVGNTQSPWRTVNVVQRIDLTSLSLKITPPGYSLQPPRSLSLKPEEIAKTPISVLEGSTLEWMGSVNPPASLGMLQLNEDDPVEMKPWSNGQRFDASFSVNKPTVASMLLVENGQVIAKLPEGGLRIACVADAPPRIEMKWPTMDLSVAPDAQLTFSAIIKDDLSLTRCRILLSSQADAPLTPVFSTDLSSPNYTLSQTIEIPNDLRVHGKVIRLQVEATDNRNLPASSSNSALPPQTALSPIYQITFRDNTLIEKQREEEFNKLRKILQEMLDHQRTLNALTVARPANEIIEKVMAGQDELRSKMTTVAATFTFSADDKIIQKTLEVLAANTAAEAVEHSRAILQEKVDAERLKLNDKLLSDQRRIMDVLEALLGKLTPHSPATQPGKAGGDLENPTQAFKDLDEILKKFMDEEKRILQASASLVKKPVDDFDNDDKKLLEELAASQDKLDSMIKEAISDFSKLAEQDMANATMLKELFELYSEVTMAKDALKQQAVDMSIPAEEMALELAQEITSNLEKWLMDTPDRLKWNQEDPLSKVDVPMAELPDELTDMIGDLMEEQEDLFDEIEDTAANWADSLDKGAGWDAMDGPIANMTAKGVTGNALPNNNEMNGRSGEGRTGKSSGEMVEDTLTGKGGRDTPTRLDPTPFQQGQVNNTSKDPVSGATGGGKLSGQGSAGLEGPVPPKDLADKMERLKGQQAELRNKLEKLELDKRAAPYDHFALMQAAANMRRVESDIQANRYGNALRRKDIVLDKISESRALVEGEMHLKKDTSPQLSDKMEDDIHNAQDGSLPPGWSDALKEYYRRLSE